MRFRRLFAALLAVPAIAAHTPSATAEPGGYAVTMTMVVNCWGCGISTGIASGTITGVYGGTAHVSAPFSASFVTNAPGGIPGVCTVSASASGTFTGSISAAFNLTYVFPGTVVVTLSGSAHVWVGYMASASINCLGQSVFTFVAGGAGI